MKRMSNLNSFLELLEVTKSFIESQDDLSGIKSGEAFETYVVETMQELAKADNKLPNEDLIKQTGSSTFPDIVIDTQFGVEVKFSKTGKWESLGNSIFESTSVRDVEVIYLLFGRKVGNKIEVRFKPYEESLIDVKVTHSPRFYVSMEHVTSIFDNLGTTYTEFKGLHKNDKGKKIKNYFRSNLQEGQEVWFLDNEETETPVAISSFGKSDIPTQNKLLIEAYILFPEVFSSSQTKYAGVSSYWITKYQVYNSALRDKFSASGQEIISLPDIGDITVKKIYKHLFNKANNIKEYLEGEHNEGFLDLCLEKWGVSVEEVEANTYLDKWLTLIDEKGVNPSDDDETVKPSDIFNAGLI
jgi:hypothetical protein